MKDIILKLYTLLIKILLYPLLMLDKTGKRSLNMVCDIVQEHTDNFVNYKLLPKYAETFCPSQIRSSVDYSEFAIVLQGLLEIKDDFTFQTVQFYKKMYTNIIIIISTWDYVDQEQLNRLKDIGCEIVLSKNISPCGTGNVNYQICTSFAGIKRAKEIGAKYVLKNRSDLRLYREFGLLYLKNLLDIFPVTPNKYNQKGRIITQAANPGQMFLPYWLQDFIYFGYTDDLFHLFDIPYSAEDIHSTVNYLKSKYKNNVVTGVTLKEEGTPELYIAKTYLSKYGNVPDTVEHFWKLIHDLFLIVDQEAIGSYWGKYGIRDLSNYYCEYDGTANFEDARKHVSHEDFVNIYCDGYVYEKWMEEKCKEYLVFKS